MILFLRCYVVTNCTVLVANAFGPQQFEEFPGRFLTPYKIAISLVKTDTHTNTYIQTHVSGVHTSSSRSTLYKTKKNVV